MGDTACGGVDTSGERLQPHPTPPAHGRPRDAGVGARTAPLVAQHVSGGISPPLLSSRGRAKGGEAQNGFETSGINSAERGCERAGAGKEKEK